MPFGFRWKCNSILQWDLVSFIYIAYLHKMFETIFSLFEKLVKGSWIDICDIQYSFTLFSVSDTQARLLFAFITNLYDPPLEEESMEVIFNTHNPDRLLPESYTCLNRLLLPLGNKDINHFRESFFKAIMEQWYRFLTYQICLFCFALNVVTCNNKKKIWMSSENKMFYHSYIRNKMVLYENQNQELNDKDRLISWIVVISWLQF